MKLSTRVRYGTRALCALAESYPRRTVSLTTIAKREGVSVKYLEQIMRPLRSAGLVTAMAGAKGGYALAQPPSKIRMSEVYGALEGNPELVACVHDAGCCDRGDDCPTRPLWAAISRAIRKELQRTRLSDLVK
jgi:Rrf2 family protein